MTEVVDPAQAPARTYGSERVRLARVSRDAALGVPGVRETDAGPAGVFQTAGGEHRVPGVTSVAAASGGYDVALRLRCELVPLPDLGEQVAIAVRAAAVVIGALVSELRVEIVDIIVPERA